MSIVVLSAQVDNATIGAMDLQKNCMSDKEGFNLDFATTKYSL